MTPQHDAIATAYLADLNACAEALLLQPATMSAAFRINPFPVYTGPLAGQIILLPAYISGITLFSDALGSLEALSVATQGHTIYRPNASEIYWKVNKWTCSMICALIFDNSFDNSLDNSFEKWRDNALSDYDLHRLSRYDTETDPDGRVWKFQRVDLSSAYPSVAGFVYKINRCAATGFLRTKTS